MSNKPQLVVTIPTLTGSLLSFLATAAAIIAHFVFPPGRHFRHALILNLLVADCINSLNNSLSGIHRIANRTKAVPAPPGLACNTNAFIGQLTVQAVDFNILIISLTVLLAVRNQKVVQEPTRLKTACLCAIPWVPALITSCLGWALKAYGPVSGNWCWIRADKTGLRYALTHGWRIGIFVATLGIYTYVYLHLKRIFNRFILSTTQGSTSTTMDHVGSLAPRHACESPSTLDAGHPGGIAMKRSFLVESPAPLLPPPTLLGPERPLPPSPLPVSVFEDDDDDDDDEDGDEDDDYDDAVPLQDLEAGGDKPTTVVTATTTIMTMMRKPTASTMATTMTTTSTKTTTTMMAAAAAVTTASARPDRVHTSAPRASRANLRRMLLLNGYPALWIALWIPGMATRLAEAVAGRSPVWLQVAQASTQYIGLANAVTYSWNEKMTQRFKTLVRWRPRGGG